MIVSRIRKLVPMAVFLAIGLAGCGGASEPKITSADEALFWINDYMGTGYSMWSSQGNPIGKAPTCYDTNGMWIAGCLAFFYKNARQLQGPEDSPWSYWQADSVFERGDGNPRVTTQCFGVIPAYGDYGTQLHETSCTKVGGPPGS